MYFAVCEDNIADRKQTERLLLRQSDRVYKESGERIYIDCYGNVDSFMKNIPMYQGLFIDMQSDECNGFEVLKLLLKAGTTSPIVMCSSTIDYRSLTQKENLSADNIIYLDKPLKVSELTEVVDKIVDRASVSASVHRFELRGQKDTVYATIDEIICVEKNGASLFVSLTGGRKVSIIEDIINFYDQCRDYKQIIPISDYCIVNSDHIKKTSRGKVFMDNDLSLSIAFSYRKIFKENYNP